MAANLGASSEAGLIEFLGLQRYCDYFGQAEGGDSTDACALESIVDNLLLEASEAFEQNGLEQEVATTSMLSIETCRFAAPKTESDVAEARRASVPKKTQTDTKYCMRLWNEWKMHRNSVTTTETIPDDITEMSSETLQYWMCRFI